MVSESKNSGKENPAMEPAERHIIQENKAPQNHINLIHSPIIFNP